MKSLFFSVILLVSSNIIQAQKAPLSGDFSNPTIQIGVVVSDLQKSVDFYINIVGMVKTGNFSVDGAKSKELGLTDGRPVNVTVLKLENSPQSNEWKLMSFDRRSSHKNQKFIYDDTGIQYVTIFVNHLEPVIERVQNNNIRILSAVPATLDDGRYFILIKDLDGTFIELIGLK